MKPFPCRLSLVLPLLLLAGCLEIEQSVTLRADGSGTHRCVLDVGDDVLRTVRAFSAAADAAARRTDPALVFQEAHVREELTRAGLQLVAFGSQEARGRRTLDISATFTAVSGLKQSPLSGGRAEWYLLRGETNGTLKLVLYPQGKDAHEAGRQKLLALEQKGADDAMRSYFEKQRQSLAGLKIKLALELPGDIQACSANWSKDGARVVRATITGADIRSPRDLVALLAPRYEVTFDGRGCKLPVDAAEPEARPVVR
jgi:hypothetical protein